MKSIPLAKQELVYHELKSIALELDVGTFERLLEEFLQKLQHDPETAKFHQYFRQYYSNRAPMWAYCYRKNARLNTNMHLEHFHQELKHVLLEGKHCKRVDKCLKTLEEYIENKTHDRLIKFHKGKITKKHTASFQNHKEGQRIHQDCLQISENVWQVKSQSIPNKDYTVSKLHDCDMQKCNILCRICVCCMMAFKCTCFSYCIGKNLCKHIHAVKINSQPHNDKSYSGPLFAVSKRNVSSFSNSSNVTNTSKEMVVKELYDLYKQASEKSAIDESICKKIMNSASIIKSLLETDTTINQSMLPTIPKVPHNKKIAPQRKFFSTKKKKIVKKRRITKPSSQESENIKSALLNNVIVSTNPMNDHDYAKK